MFHFRNHGLNKTKQNKKHKSQILIFTGFDFKILSFSLSIQPSLDTGNISFIIYQPTIPLLVIQTIPNHSFICGLLIFPLPHLLIKPTTEHQTLLLSTPQGAEGSHKVTLCRCKEM